MNIFFGNKTVKPKTNPAIKKACMLRLCNQIYKNENNVGADALSKKPIYNNPNKFIKPMLVKNGNYMQITEVTEKNNDIIRNAHDNKINRASKKIKTLKKIQEKTTWKNIKADVEKYVKNYLICAIGKHDRLRKKKLH